VTGAIKRLRFVTRSRSVLALVLTAAALSAYPSSASAISEGMSWSGAGYEQNAADWEAIQLSGAKVYRLSIEKQEVNKVGWKSYEDAFRLASERGIRILPFIYNWNDGSGRFPIATEYSAWKAWVEQVVHRFGSGGTFWQDKANPLPPTTWEIWNEPNVAARNPGGVKVQPENYARFLKESASAVWNAQPSPLPSVFFGGLLSAFSEDSSKMKVRKFLEKADNVAETGSFFNQLSLHPYGFSGGVLVCDAV
jgi:hypothetical protein